MKDFFNKLKVRIFDLIKSLTPQILTKLIKDVAVKYGLSLTGIQGFFVSILIKFGLRKAEDLIENAQNNQIDKINHNKLNEVRNDPNSTLEDKVQSELDLLNGKRP